MQMIYFGNLPGLAGGQTYTFESTSRARCQESSHLNLPSYSLTDLSETSELRVVVVGAILVRHESPSRWPLTLISQVTSTDLFCLSCRARSAR